MKLNRFFHDLVKIRQSLASLEKKYEKMFFFLRKNNKEAYNRVAEREHETNAHDDCGIAR